MLEYQSRTAKENMALDTYFLENMSGHDEPILHLYSWKNPSLTYGVLARPENLLNFSVLDSLGFDYARRSTGGGVLFHTLDLAFSLIMPTTHPHYRASVLDNYLWINKLVQKAIDSSTQLLNLEQAKKGDVAENFCMARGTQYDIMVGEKKLYGSAQRRKKNAFLHQASICLYEPDYSLLKKILKNHDPVIGAMKDTSFYLLSNKNKRQKQILHNNLKKIFTNL